MNNTKSKTRMFLLFKTVGFLVVFFILYRQLNQFKSEDFREVKISNYLFLMLAIVLVLPNLWLGFKKWTLIVNRIDKKATLKTKIQSYFAGIVTGFFTPNMLGNFIGRIYYFERNARVKIVLATLFSNFTQFFSTLIFGCIAVVLLGNRFELGKLNYVLFVSLIIGIFVFHSGEKVVFFVNKKNWARDFKNWMKVNSSLRYSFLFWSVLRLLVYNAQFSFMMMAFGETASIDLFLGIFQVYLLMLFVPSLFLAKLGMKESVSIFILGSLGFNVINVLLASLAIWLLNNVIPALWGMVICKESNRA